ncbi:MAG: PD-(D/E)XK nuclease family protein [Spirochaetaceae bacterium]|jgi:hypothetical protein|nr:PD-(D/E)XK nuclease family protein [Spirochaetaceae bacterium]
MRNLDEAGRLILEKLDSGTTFVFPSESSASAYASYILARSGRQALRMDKFIAWDTFTAKAVKAAHGAEAGGKNRKSASPLIRKLFAAMVLEENAKRGAAGGEPFFTTIVPQKYAGFSASFTSWTAGILPRLSVWAETVHGIHIHDIAKIKTGMADMEKDLQTLAVLYHNFLDNNKLYESAWERPPFISDGSIYLIFFPEVIDDFSDYEPLLKKAAPYVDFFYMSNPEKPARSFFYQNAQSEIIEAALYILNLHQNGVPYSEICVSVPAIDDYLPYITKEFNNRGIPIEDKNGRKLADYPAGRLFKCIQDCAAKKFSFNSVVSLLANRSLRWKEPGQINKLIDFGLRNNCVCSWEEDGKSVDVWKASGFSSEDTAVFYADLKEAVLALCGAKTFNAVKRAYFAFRTRFLDVFVEYEKHTEADDVLSRCINELAVLCDIAAKHPAIKVSNPYAFWIKHLSETVYTRQANTDGVPLLPYRIAAAVPAAYHIILGANQHDMAQTNSRMDFLPKTLRRNFGLDGKDASEAFFNLHKITAEKDAVFFCSEQTFSGYEIPFGLLDADAPRLRYAPQTAGGREPDAAAEAAHAVFFDDLFYQERRRFRGVQAGGLSGSGQCTVHSVQKRGFDAFCRRERAVPPDSAVSPPGAASSAAGLLDFDSAAAAQAVRRRFFGVENGEEVLYVSASALKPFYECSLKWLFSRVMRLKTPDTEASVSDPFVWGNLYHLILGRFFQYVQENNIVLGEELLEAGINPPDKALLAITDDIFENLEQNIYTSLIKRHILYPQKMNTYNQMKYVIAEIARMFPAHKVFLVEEALKAPFLPSRLQSGTSLPAVYLEGRPDLVLQDEAGALIILDFKSSGEPAKKDCFAEGDGLLHDFQMPMYNALLQHSTGTGAQAAAFVNIKAASVKKYFAPAGSGGREKTCTFAELEEIFARQADMYAQSVLMNNFNMYINRQYTVCNECDYKTICRRTYAIRGASGSPPSSKAAEQKEAAHGSNA